MSNQFLQAPLANLSIRVGFHNPVSVNSRRADRPESTGMRCNFGGNYDDNIRLLFSAVAAAVMEGWVNRCGGVQLNRWLVVCLDTGIHKAGGVIEG